MTTSPRAARWPVGLAMVPALAIIGAPFVANRVEPRLLGMPFLLAWIVGWVVATSVIMWWIGHAERAAGVHAGTDTDTGGP